MKVTFALGLLLLAAGAVPACELCAIYSAENAVRQSGRGFLFTVSGQYIPFRTRQFEGNEIDPPFHDYLDRTIIHIVPGYNFSTRFGVSLNVPFMNLDFKRTDIRYSRTALPELETEEGTDFGLGDVSLIFRVTVFQKSEMTHGLVVNLLGAVKFPTGDTDRIKEEVTQAKIFDSFVPLGTPHDPLGHSISGLHLHELAFGSGSYDGIFGLTFNARWRRAFFNGQLQYYYRTEGESDFRYGNETIASGGPGAFLYLNESATFSVQLNMVYDIMGKAEVLGRKSDNTGQSGFFLGPVLNLTLGERFNANLGVDVPTHIENNGRQNVSEYRLHGGVTWHF